MTKTSFKLTLLGSAAALLIAAAPGSANADGERGQRFFGFLQGGVGFMDNSEVPYASGGDDEELNNPQHVGVDRQWNAAGGVGFYDGPMSYQLRISGLASEEGSDDLGETTYIYNHLAGASTATLSDYALAETHLYVFQVDLEAGYDVGLGENTIVTFAGGLRGLYVHQEVSSIICCGDPELQEADIGFWGVAPQVNVRGRANFDSNWSLGGGVGGSVLFGRQIDNRRSAGSSVGIMDDHDSHGGLAYTLEGNLGVTYAFDNRMWGSPVFITLGYQAQWLADVLDTKSGFVPEDHRALGTTNGDLFHHGAFLRVGVELP